MRRGAGLVLVAATLTMSASGAPVLGEEGASGDVARLVADLVSGDAARRDAATLEVKRRGLPVALDLLRPALGHLGGPGEEPVLSAFAALGVDQSIAFLSANQTAWPGNRGAVKDLLGKLRRRRAPGLTRSVRLSAATLEDPRRLPPSVEQRVQGSIPPWISGISLRTAEVDGRLQIDAAAEGKRLAVVEPTRPKVLDVGPPPSRKVIVHRRREAWFAGPASLLTGKIGSERVDLLDADGDGVFDGPEDLVSVAEAPFQRIAHAEFVVTSEGTASFRCVVARGVPTLEVTPEPRLASADPVLLNTVAELNRWRRDVGLPPTFLDLPRSRHCQAHADYWYFNGYSGHEELAEGKGYTREGALAGKSSSCITSPDPLVLVSRIAHTILHRKSLIGDPRYGVGVGYRVGSLLWGGEPRTQDRGSPILVPGPGQRKVVTRCTRELPTPSRDASFYSAPRGHPILVAYSGLFTNVVGARFDVWPASDAAAAPLRGDTFSRESPYVEPDSTGVGDGMACFVADRPLGQGTWYHVRFTATADGRPVELWWSFETERERP